MSVDIERPLRRWDGGPEAPLSHAQERLWFIDAAAPGAATYHVPLLLRWREPVDPAALSAALAAVLARHHVLRTVYPRRDGRPVQRLDGAARVEVRVVDLAGVPNPERQLAEQAEAAARLPFDLAGEPPVRCHLWRGAPGGDATLLTFHHIAIDGWSLSVLFADLDTAYRAALAGRPADLPELDLQYVDYAAWDREVTAGEPARRRLAARVEELRPYTGPVRLGRGEPVRTAPLTRRGGQVVFEVADPLRGQVYQLANRLRATPFVVLLAAYQAVLQRWSGRAEFLVGTVTANRPHPALEQLIGFFVNTVPLRCAPRPRESFATLCADVRAESFRALGHQLIPFDQLSAAMGDGGPLVQVGFALQNVPAWDSARFAWHAPIQLPTGTAKFDLFLIFEERAESLVGTVEYDLDVCAPQLAAQLSGHFQVLLAAAVADPERPVCRLPLTAPQPGELPPCVLVGPARDLVSARLAGIGGAA